MALGNAQPLADDLLRGAAEIADFVFGDRAKRRQVYLLAGQRGGRLPCFKIGNTICARKSTLLTWIAEQEGAR